jgi:hypothetical protein
MGLDMYLTAKKWLSSYDEEDEKIAKAIQNLLPELSGMYGYHKQESSVIDEISVNIGYWRKANAIHFWFVKNVQKMNDDCNTYFVSSEKLKDLKKTVNQVIEDPSKANDLLPTKEGFFFGSCDYGDYYFYYLKQTLEIIQKAQKLSKLDYIIEYRSSW